MLVWFGVLGPLEVFDDDGSLRLPPGKPRDLLAILLTRANGPVSADRLLDLLWPEGPPRTARSNLQVYVHRLRRVLGDDRIVHTDAGYRIVVDPGEVDAARFEALWASGSYHEALAQWRGDAYAGAADIELVREESVRLAELRLSTLEERVDADLELGRHAHLVPELTGLVSQHPLRERFRGQLMTALYRSGRTPEALEVYRETRQRLIDELGLEPSRPLRLLEQAILSEDPSLDLEHSSTVVSATPVVPAELPTEIGTFTGREDDLERVRTLLNQGDSDTVPIVAIPGPGGIGKSALAVHAARRVSDAFPDGQLYVNLQGATPGVRPLAPREVLGRLLRSLGTADFAVPRDVDEASGRLRTLTSGRKLLIVLDDAVDDTQVRPLLPGGSDSAVLVTSRSVLTSLDGATHHRLSALDRDEATSLLGRIVGKERRDAEPDAAADLVRMCDHLPLAVCIAGAKLARRPTWQVRSLVNRMADEQRRLDELDSTDRAVRASFTVSSADLDPEAARLFRLLGLLGGPDIGVPVAAALADRSETETERMLDQLLDAQLADSHIPGRYRLHDLLRLFAREQTDAQETQEERAAAVRRALDCYLATSLNAEWVQNPDSWRSRYVPRPLTHPGISLSDDAEVGGWLSAETANLVAAARQGATVPGDGPVLAAAFAAVLFAPLNTRGRWYELRTLVEIGLQASCTAALWDHHALMCNDLGWIDALLGREDEAIPRLQPALEHWRQTGDKRGEATTLRVYARALSQLGHDEDALEYARSAHALFGDLGDRHGEIDCLVAIGLQCARLGRLDDAIAAHEEGITISEHHGDLWHTGVLVGNAADLHRRAGDLAKAVTQFERALDVDRASGNARTYFEAEHLWGLGASLHALGDAADARGCWDRSTATLRDLGLIGADEFDTLMSTPVPETPEVIARQL